MTFHKDLTHIHSHNVTYVYTSIEKCQCYLYSSQNSKHLYIQTSKYIVCWIVYIFAFNAYNQFVKIPLVWKHQKPEHNQIKSSQHTALRQKQKRKTNVLRATDVYFTVVWSCNICGASNRMKPNPPKWNLMCLCCCFFCTTKTLLEFKWKICQ